ncbi:UPF0481 protein At3g47200-like [Miscanthus floridulus]|uniref:UPF0481 protein At3g47200-like n=1 Tax=Miscanthus floridulus TaxID=154761 RepID=UPI00345AA601
MADGYGAITPARQRLSQTAVVVHDHDAIEDGTVQDSGTMESMAIRVHFLNKSILRFPSNLQRIAAAKDYIAPRTVALGPYYHGLTELQAMEEVKRTAVDFFFQGLVAPETTESAYQKMVPIARHVRGWYAAADAGAVVVAGTGTAVSADEFATMMFVDGCFLVQFIDTMLRSRVEETAASPLRSMMQPHLLGILRDIMLLENQIPWPVTEFFMRLQGLQMKQIIALLISWGLEGRVWRDSQEPLSLVDIDERYNPLHLLDLIRFYKVGSGSGSCGGCVKRNNGEGFSGKAVPISTSAAELAEMGIKLRASENKTKLSDMNLMKGPLFATLSLPPLYVDSLTANWLVNMAAFEMCSEASSTDEYSVNSYLSVLSLLMNQENDVRELRVKHMVHGFFGDQQTLEFFKILTPILYPGQAYIRIIVDLETYRQKRRAWIAVYSFLYNNAKTIATVLSIVGVLVGIFKALYSLKKHQM